MTTVSIEDKLALVATQFNNWHSLYRLEHGGARPSREACYVVINQFYDVETGSIVQSDGVVFGAVSNARPLVTNSNRA